MATRQSPSRETSLSRLSTASSHLSNPDIFSDDFAVPSPANSPDVSPIDSMQNSSDQLPDIPSSSQGPPARLPSTPRTYLNTTSFSRPSSTAKRPLTLEDGHNLAPHHALSHVSYSDGATHRSSSISSHFSIPRSQSPYVGPTAPSQPYAMYPQVTRASSIASESTIRPVERAYVGTTGPEHPYGLYPQNAVEEEDASHPPTSNIPLGFPGMGQIYQAQAQATSHDIADIVGSDGHVEQLPPYTRYADNTIAKGATQEVALPTAPTTTDIPLSPISQTSDGEVELNTGAARAAGEPNPEYSEKSTRRKLKRKICFGVSLCVWLLIAAVVVVAGTLGGVVGGVIGNNRATDAAADNSSPQATTTVWLDANPLPTNAPQPECVAGSFNMPTNNQTINEPGCVADQKLSFVWDCEYDIPVPFNISYGPNQQPLIQLGAPYPGKTGQPFSYGPQVPDLNGTQLPLSGKVDKDDPSAGSTMFFWTYYNKLTIVQQKLFETHQSRRSIDASELAELGTRSSTYLVSSLETPYFCWFNQSVLEFFIYSEVNTSAAAASSTSHVYPWSSFTTTSTPRNNAAATTTGPMLQQYTEEPESSEYNTRFPPARMMERRRGEEVVERDYTRNPPVYPQQVRLAEKRKPSPNIQPFCVQMRVEEDWTVCPIGPNIPITEIEYHSSSSRSRRWEKRQSSNALDSACACQWNST